jgi:hypothetical protein
LLGFESTEQYVLLSYLIIPQNYRFVKFLGQCVVTDLGARVVTEKGLCYGFEE